MSDLYKKFREVSLRLKDAEIDVANVAADRDSAARELDDVRREIFMDEDLFSAIPFKFHEFSQWSDSAFIVLVADTTPDDCSELRRVMHLISGNNWETSKMVTIGADSNVWVSDGNISIEFGSKNAFNDFCNYYNVAITNQGHFKI